MALRTRSTLLLAISLGLFNLAPRRALRGGLVVEYRFRPGEALEPWVGYGAGYDQGTITMAGPPSALVRVSGFDLGHIRGGLDFLVHPSIALGFYSDIGFGQFIHEHAEGPSEPTIDQGIVGAAWHEWFTFGLRSTFMP